MLFLKKGISKNNVYHDLGKTGCYKWADHFKHLVHVRPIIWLQNR